MTQFFNDGEHNNNKKNMSYTKDIHDFTVKCDTYHLSLELICEINKVLKDFIDNRFWEILHYSINETFTSMDYEIVDNKFVVFCNRINEKTGNLDYDTMFEIDLSVSYISEERENDVYLSIYNYIVYKLLKEVNDNIIEKLGLDFVKFYR